MLTEGNVKGILYAFIATAALVILLALLRLLFKRLDARVEVSLAHSDWALKIQQLKLLSAEGIKRGLAWTIRSIHTLSALFVIYLYIPVVLLLFPWTEPLAQPFADYFLDPLSALAHVAPDW